MKNPFLIGKNIYLSPLTKADISEQYISWLNDAEVCRDNSHAIFPYTEVKALAYIESVTKNPGEVVLTIRTKKTNVHVGNVALFAIDLINRNARLGILIGNKKYWGKGIATECYQLLIKHGFYVLNLNRISSEQTIRNLGMVKVCEKNGMKKEGVLRQLLFKEGSYLDVVQYSILKKEYKG